MTSQFDGAFPGGTEISEIRDFLSDLGSTPPDLHSFQRGNSATYLDDPFEHEMWVNPDVVTHPYEITEEISTAADVISENYFAISDSAGRKQDRKDIKILQRPIETILFGRGEASGIMTSADQVTGLVRALQNRAASATDRRPMRAAKFEADLNEALEQCSKDRVLSAAELATLFRVDARLKKHDTAAAQSLIKGSFDTIRDAEAYSLAFSEGFKAMIAVSDEPQAANSAVHTLTFNNTALDHDRTIDRLGPFLETRHDHPEYVAVQLSVELLSAAVVANDIGVRDGLFFFATRQNGQNYQRNLAAEQAKALQTLSEDELAERRWLSLALSQNEPRLNDFAALDVETIQTIEKYEKSGKVVSAETIEWLFEFNHRGMSDLSRASHWAYSMNKMITDDIKKKHKDAMTRTVASGLAHGLEGYEFFDDTRIQSIPLASFPFMSGVVAEVYSLGKPHPGMKSDEHASILIYEASDHLLRIVQQDPSWEMAVKRIQRARLEQPLLNDPASLSLGPVPFAAGSKEGIIPTAIYLRASTDLEEQQTKLAMHPTAMRLPFMPETASEHTPSTGEILTAAEEFRMRIAPDIKRWPSKSGVEISITHDKFAASGLIRMIARQSDDIRYTHVSFYNESGDNVELYLDPELRGRTTVSTLMNEAAVARLAVCASALLCEYFTFEPPLSKEAPSPNTSHARVAEAINSQPPQLVRLPVGHSPGDERIEAYRIEKNGDLVARSEDLRSSDPEGKNRASTYRKAVETAKKHAVLLQVPDDAFDAFA